MRAAIIAVGSELLGTDRLDTNSLALTEELARYGVELVRKAVVGDSIAEIAAEVTTALARADLVLVTGGLGPTSDDVTREAVAEATGRELVHDPEVLAAIERRYASFARKMPAVNRKQADVLLGAQVIPNPRGTAPGMRLEHGGATVFLFPGVPGELMGLIASHLVPWLAERSGGVGRESAVIKAACVPESTMEERIAPAYDDFGREAITILAKPGEVTLIATAVGPEAERRERLAAMTARLEELAGDAVFAHSAEETLEGVVGELLRRTGGTLAAAESCTGGLLAERVTRIPGSSDYFVGGAVTYTNALKTRLLGVSEELLAENGAVSEPVARAMAEGARQALGATWGIGITGVAGPGGGSDAKPVGTVHLAVAGPGGTVHHGVRFPGSREMIRWQSTQLALETLRRALLAGAAP